MWMIANGAARDPSWRVINVSSLDHRSLSQACRVTDHHGRYFLIPSIMINAGCTIQRRPILQLNWNFNCYSILTLGWFSFFPPCADSYGAVLNHECCVAAVCSDVVMKACSPTDRLERARIGLELALFRTLRTSGTNQCTAFWFTCY